MTTRHLLALNTTPLILRILLGLFFLWLGAGKLLDDGGVAGDRAAALANMGVLTPDAPPAPAPAEQPATHQAAPKPTPAPHTRGTYTSDDFPKIKMVKRVYVLAADIYQAAHPFPTVPAVVAPGATGATGSTGATGATGPTGAPAPAPAAPAPILHPALAQGEWPVYAAWGVALVEMVGGVCILLGLLTRLWAVGVACVMVGAMWLDQIGPAIQSGHAMYGFLPNYEPFDPAPWRPLLMQFALFMCALALACSGAGRMSLDRSVFGSKE